MKDNKKSALQLIKENRGSIIRIFVVAFVCLLAIMYTIYKEDTKTARYLSSENTAEPATEMTTEAVQDNLILDEQFTPCYVMICNASEEGIKTTDLPSSQGQTVRKLKNGEIVWAQGNGTYQDVSYYKLEDGSYLLDEDEYVMELKSFTSVSGYVVITFVSEAGVKLRSWANFDDDNVIKKAFVGDQITINAKIVTEYDEEAYRTEEGLYMTTDSSYFEDHTQTEDTSDTVTVDESEQEDESEAESADISEQEDESETESADDQVESEDEASE